MNTAACCMPRTIPLSRPWPLRWAQAVADGLRDVRAALAEARRQREAERAQAWDARALEGLADHVLRDIGAPEWVRAEAAARRAAELRGARLNSGHLFDGGL